MPIWGYLCIGLPVLIVVLFVAFWLWLRARERKQQEYYKRYGTALVGWIVQANQKLYEPEGWDNVAQVLIDLKGTPGAIDETVGEFATRVASLKGSDPRDLDLATVAQMVNDEGYAPFERHLLPESFVDNREIYSFHIWVERTLLPKGGLKHPFIRCYVLKDEPEKRIIMAPYLPDDDDYRLD